ncbi:polyphosphate:AMP phosphotransferase [Pseudoxanthobacter sp.]|uniref:polyphosphate:AMP phosphotransferase n=1 Tax=Pseudoxanthobacter sp. TaxID=1925742 RepID=UPI002FE39F68
MFDSATLTGHTLSKDDFKTLAPQLREDLLNAQFELVEQRRKAVLILLNGPDGSGKGHVLTRLYQWLDAHYLETISYDDPDGVHRHHPMAWRYWRDLPAKGRIGVMLGSWYHQILRGVTLGNMSPAELTQTLDRTNRMEAMLSSEGVVIIKLWLYLSRDDAIRRLERDRNKLKLSDLTIREWPELDTARAHDRLLHAAIRVAEQTSTPHAPWEVVPAADGRYRDAAVGKVLLDALVRATVNGHPPAVQQTSPAAPTVPLHQDVVSVASATPVSNFRLPATSLVGSLDLSRKLDEEAYRSRLEKAQHRLADLTISKGFRKRGVICAFEGNDAAGKGGAIMRLRQALDPRRVRVWPIARPSDEELAHPYLWRFWRRIPALGHTAVFDRSWYGRVLVERVEGFCTADDWTRAYGEINDFERDLDANGYLVVKFWLAISPEEQYRRFKEREAVPFKRFKLTDEDWRNREKWPLYETAVNEMVDRTSTSFAPWTLVEAEDKRFARVKVLETIVRRLERALD